MWSGMSTRRATESASDHEDLPESDGNEPLPSRLARKTSFQIDTAHPALIFPSDVTPTREALRPHECQPGWRHRTGMTRVFRVVTRAREMQKAGVIDGTP